MKNSVYLTPLASIETNGGCVNHVIKATESTFQGFGEVYTTSVNYGIVRSWKRHNLATCNLVVAVGMVRFVVQTEPRKFTEYVLCNENYSRLTIPPGFWFGFKGLAHGSSLIINVSDIVHSKHEVDASAQDEFIYNWDN